MLNIFRKHWSVEMTEKENGTSAVLETEDRSWRNEKNVTKEEDTSGGSFSNQIFLGCDF